MKNNAHEYHIMPEGVLVKDYQPTYKIIEVCQMGMPIGIFKLKDVLNRFGDRELISVVNFHDTKTTSYMLGKELNKKWS